MTVIPNNSKKISELTERKAIDTDIIPIVRSGNNDRINVGTLRTKYELELDGTIDYGLLYNWYAVNTGKLAPIGYRIPTDSDWNTLGVYLGGLLTAGGILKSIRVSPAEHPRWNLPNTGASDGVNIKLLPGGARNVNGTFGNVGVFGKWWSSTQDIATDAFLYTIIASAESLEKSSANKNYGYSALFLRDASVEEQILEDGVYIEIATDASENLYGMVKVGTQIWSTSNLKTTKYNDGTNIPNVTDNTEWANDSIGAYCSYNNEPLETYSDDYVLPIIQISEDDIICSNTNTLVILNGKILNSYNYTLVDNLLTLNIEVKRGDILILKN